MKFKVGDVVKTCLIINNMPLYGRVACIIGDTYKIDTFIHGYLKCKENEIER